MNIPNHTERAARVPGGPGRSTTPMRSALRERVLTHAPAPMTRFEQAHDAVEHDDLGKWDTHCRRRDLVMKSGALCLRAQSDNEEEGERLHPTRWALGQMCSRLGVPASYFAACPPLLQDIQGNYWLQHGPVTASARHFRGNARAEAEEIDLDETPEAPKQEVPKSEERWLLRAKGDRLRAVLSSTYSPLDSKLVMETLAPLLSPRLRVDWFALSDEAMHLRLVDPTKARDILPGDGLSVGVHISNSEVGARSLCVDALVYRLVCSNGLIALVKGQSLLRRRHVHMAPMRFRAALEEAVAAAFATAEGFLDHLRDSTRQSVPDPEIAIERLGERWGLSEPVRDAAKVALWREKTQVRHSAYGLVNAFTGVAQLLADDKRYDLEVLAGQLAQDGVPAFALAPREKQIAVGRDLNGASDVHAENDVIEHTRAIFDAQIVSRRPLALVAVGKEHE